jgi:flagellar hook-length control protein FliK
VQLGEPTAAEAPAPVTDTPQPVLDTGRSEWIDQMAEQIEAMRDASPTRETRIRLAPDALGSVDVSIRHDGERVHVHFAAETSAGRQLLSDAQPRLAEIAESRGVRLGQTNVDGGGAGAQPHGQRQEAPRTPQRPLAAAAAHPDTPSDDDRIA